MSERTEWGYLCSDGSIMKWRDETQARQQQASARIKRTEDGPWEPLNPQLVSRTVTGWEPTA